MAGESAFDKRLTAETTLDKIEALLEHFNLPPGVVSYLRRHMKIILVLLVVALVAIVSGSLYRSYRQNLSEDAASALAKAMQLNSDAKVESLQKVSKDFSSTTAATWAKVEQGHLDMQKGAYQEAASKFKNVLNGLKKNNPLSSLVTYSLAQAYEADKKFTEATSTYEKLKDIKGFEQIAYFSLARIEETQGNLEKAIAVFNNFLLIINNDPSLSQAKEQTEAKIARLKSRL